MFFLHCIWNSYISDGLPIILTIAVAIGTIVGIIALISATKKLERLKGNFKTSIPNTQTEETETKNITEKN